VEFARYDIWPDHSEWLLARIRVWMVGWSESQQYALPLALAWEEDGEEKLRPLWPYALARVRIKARMGLLYGAFADERFCQRLVELMAQDAQIPLGQGWLRFSTTRAFAKLAGNTPGSLAAKRLALDSSNTAIAIGDRLLMKAYRRLQPGISPELEIARFLTEHAFPNIAPVAAALEYEDEVGERFALVMLQGFMENQGDAWSYTQDYLKRCLMAGLEPPQNVEKEGRGVHASYLLLAAVLGQRTGELHHCLAQANADPAFKPEPMTTADVVAWLERIREEALATLAQLRQAQQRLPEPIRPLAEQVLAAEIALPQSGCDATLASQILKSDDIAAIEILTPQAMKTRYHGDYHLGQVLVTKEDVIIIDFEGEPSRSLAERRAKHCPLRDVVGMLRSFNYAAHMALRQATADGIRDRATLAAYLNDWEQQSRQAFLESYVAAVGDSPAYPTDPDQVQMLMELFTLEKVCYELRYELDNRPDWVEIPLRGLQEVLGLPGRLGESQVKDRSDE
jgi:maltose alpha-D-glucosyltransferase/alpha-amylase